MMNNFSAFKLFYDEIIYKKNSYVSYANIEEEIVQHIMQIQIYVYVQKTKHVEEKPLVHQRKPIKTQMKYAQVKHNATIIYMLVMIILH